MNAPTTEVVGRRDTATTLRWTVGALTTVVVGSMLAVLAIPGAVLALIIGGTVTFFVKPGRTISAIAAGLLGLLVVVLASMYLSDGDLTPSPWTDAVFVYVGGLLGLATVVLSGMTLTGRPNR